VADEKKLKPSDEEGKEESKIEEHKIVKPLTNDQLGISELQKQQSMT
jgi:hypothetical protein